MADELPPIIQAANRFRAAVLRSERAAAVRLVQAYGRAYQRLLGDIDSLIDVIASMPSPTWGQVERLGLYRSLLGQIQEQIGRFAVIAENEIGDGTRAAILAALSDSQRLVRASLPGLEAATVRAAWARLVPEQVETIMGFLADDSPLFQNLRLLGDDVAALVAQKLQEGIILGRNPRVIAREIRDATGQGLTWSLNMTRTANLWTYREATRANYVANSHIVKGWTWWAELGSDRTCLSCIMMHGTEHTLDEVLNDHHSGRCLLPGQQVITARGAVNIEDAKVGDMVLTHGGRYHKVTGTSNHHYSGVVLKLDSGRLSVIVTPEHRVLTQRGFVEARSLSVRDILVTLVTLRDVETRLSSRSIVQLSYNYSGLVYDLSVEEDHSFIAGGIVVHNCAMLPITKTYAELGLNVPEDRQPIQSGIDWFGTLTPTQQRELMGGARYAAWQAGEFELSALSQPYENDVYGEMLREASLKGLLGDRARQYYGR